MALKWLRPICIAAAISLCGLPASASDNNNSGRLAFNWFANAAKAPQADKAARQKAALIRARALSRGATWVCSPAGSGQKASCYRG
jgi:hypothetical protein